MRDRTKDPALVLTADERSRLLQLDFGCGRLATYERAQQLHEQAGSSLRQPDDEHALKLVDEALAAVVAANRAGIVHADKTSPIVEFTGRAWRPGPGGGAA